MNMRQAAAVSTALWPQSVRRHWCFSCKSPIGFIDKRMFSVEAGFPAPRFVTEVKNCPEANCFRAEASRELAATEFAGLSETDLLMLISVCSKHRGPHQQLLGRHGFH